MFSSMAYDTMQLGKEGKDWIFYHFYFVKAIQAERDC